MEKCIDLIGQKFERLTVTNREKNNKSGQSMWLCRCDCGNERIVLGQNLRGGLTKSCGCYHAERVKESKTTHGLTKTRIHRIWANMKRRCLNKNDSAYKNYGGRGISVCEEWLNSFQTFHEWAMHNGYNDMLTIDRIEVNGNYEPLNCRWVSLKEQQNNRTNNHRITFNGRTLTLHQWSEELEINYQKLFSRICYYHWSPEKAFCN